MTVQQNLPKQSLRKFLFYVILTTSYLRSQTIDVIITYRFFVTLFKQIDFFFSSKPDCINCKHLYARVTRVPPRDFAFWAKSLRGQKKKKKKKNMYHLCGLSGQVDYVFNPKQNDLDRY